MKFKIDEITSVIQQEISQYQNQLDVTQAVGKVIEVGDGIARIYGLRAGRYMAGQRCLGAPGGIFPARCSTWKRKRWARLSSATTSC